MKRSLLALAVASLVFAAAASAKPIASFGGCAANTPLAAGHIYGQTFTPTFSVVKRVRFVLFGDASLTEDTMFQVVLKTPGGNILSASDYEVLAAGTSHDDAAAGDAVTFKFHRGGKVTPGQTYVLELVRIGGSAPISACVTANAYPGGMLLYDGAYNMGWDFEFGVKGSVPAK